jgi:hypothetical protein
MIYTRSRHVINAVFQRSGTNCKRILQCNQETDFQITYTVIQRIAIE